MIALLILQLWMNRLTPQGLASGVKFEGSWQSCQDESGDYGERIFTYAVRGVAQWTAHLGPQDEFALFKGEGPLDEDDDHTSPANLLGVAFHYNAFTTRAGGRTWTTPSVGLLVNVVAAGGSRDDCMAFEVKIERLRP